MITLENSKEKIGREVYSSQFLPKFPDGEADTYFRDKNHTLAYKVTPSNSLTLYEILDGQPNWILVTNNHIALPSKPVKVAAVTSNGLIYVVAKLASGSMLYAEKPDKTGFTSSNLSMHLESFALASTAPHMEHPHDVTLWALSSGTVKTYTLADNFTAATPTNLSGITGRELTHAGFNRKFEFQLTFEEIEV